ncbi:MAG: FecR domain-containing protein [Candidatus Eisenbacteria bacterium]|nr:FecR domain-containing protein [Candidatus Eisenbacteria bacterium]
MRDDYLWDKSGEPDADVAKLERALAPLGHRGVPLALPDAIAAPARARRGTALRAWAIAAALIAVAGIAALWWARARDSAWAVARLDGAPRVGAGTIHGTGSLAVGEWLETDAGSRARVTVGRIGDLLVEPNTRLRLIGAGGREHRMHLARGTVTALILAQPRQFVVETPSAAAVDLGCAYTLQVDASGGALVTVLAGWVSFEREGRDSFIPAGARCATRPGFGPGTPCMVDASPAFKNALAALDLAGDAAARDTALAALLPAARRADALSLWHLLAWMRGRERDDVYARLAALVPPPAGVTREGVLAGERAMLDRWWDALGLGEARYWREWQRAWPQPGAAAAASPAR